ncbi:MAG: cation-translocating P-type ATPase, partial [Anaerolineales bacterium]
LHHLATPPGTGLSSEEASRRLAEYGPNQLTEAPPTSLWQMIWEQFNNFVVGLLLAAVITSAVLGDWAEAAAILLIVVLNAALGVVQERRAEQALAALRQLASPDADVIRDGHRTIVPAHEVVPGDVVLLEAGNYIPADVRLLEAVNLRVEEAALTGESVPVQKDAAKRLKADIPLGDRKNTAFMGTLVSYGRGKGVIVNTGMRTQIGLIAKMLQAVHQEPTPLQKRLDQLGKTLGYVALSLCGLVFVLGWIRGEDPLEMFLIAVSLAIAAVPEGLPAVVTIALALGMREMIQRNALIRRLSSVETLGSATVIGSDKTGTLTQNEMTVTRLWVDNQLFDVTGSGYVPKGEFRVNGKTVALHDYPAALTALWVGALNNDASLEVSEETSNEVKVHIVGDPTEGALLVAAAKVGALQDALTSSYPRVQEIPFDSARKRMVTFHEVRAPHTEDISPFTDEQPRVHVVVVKGAPDIVLEMCTQYQTMDDRTAPLDRATHDRVLGANDRMTGDALRVLGVAYRLCYEVPSQFEPEEIEQDLIFAGLIGMIDPPRPEVRLALEKAARAGIRTVMITGDYPNTARAIAESIGLMHNGQQVLTGSDLNQMSDSELQAQIGHTAVFARVSPEHKVRIVQTLRDSGQVVAMTGDGVNDAPALKRADIGVAMGITGTDVAKETADMVLTDDNYASIVSAVEQGRVIYGNIRKFVYYLLSCNLAEIAIISIATFTGQPRPLEAIQLLWLNLVTDGAPALALGVEKGDPDTMDVPPRPPDEPIINKPLRIGIITQTISLTLVTLGAFFWGLNAYSEEVARTMAFVTLSASELPLAFIVRSERYSLFKIGPFTNKMMNLALISSLFLLLLVVYVPFLQPIFHTTPLGWEQWRFLLPMVFVPAVVAEIVKLLTVKSWSYSQKD